MIYRTTILSLIASALAASIAQAVPDAQLAKCAVMLNDVERLACFDELARSAGLDRPKTTSRGVKNWQVRKETSPIDDSTNVYVSLRGDGEFRGWLKQHRPILFLRCKENRTEAYILTGMPPNVEYGGDHATATLRYDKTKAFDLRMSKSTDGEALFFPNAISEIKRMMKHDSLLFQFTPFNSSPTMTTFPIAGLAEAVQPLREQCSW